MMYLNKRKIKYILLGVICVAVSNCKPSASDITEASDTIQVDTVSSEIDVSHVVPDENPEYTQYLFPSPGEVMEEILNTEIEYNPKLLNSPGNAAKYLDVKLEALNLGVYLSDLAYANIYEDQNTALSFLDVARDLSMKLNIYKVLDDKVYERVQNNLNNKDSISTIASEVYMNIRDLLESTHRNNIYALIASGALIEALYLSAMSVDNFREYKDVAVKIFEQKHLLNNFYDYASVYKADPNVKEILILFEKYRKVMENVTSRQKPVSVKTDKKGKMKISGGEEIVITEEEFRSFKKDIEKTRMEIVQGTK